VKNKVMKHILFFIHLILVSSIYAQTVGINTTTPDPLFKLDVNGPITSNGLRSIGTSNYISIFDQGNSNQFWNWQANGGYARLAYNSISPNFTRNIFVINNDGKVGIGTANPTTWLDVSNSLGGQAARFNGGNSMWLTLSENGINRGYLGSFLENPEDIDFGTYSGNTTGKLHLATNGLARLTINEDGDALFQNGSSPMDLSLKSNSTRNLFFKNNSDVTQAIIKSSGENLYLGRGNVFTDLTIDSDGDVGIGGEIIPASKLTVVGGNDVNYSSHGFVMLGNPSLSNLIMDQNEILARNNGGEADLFVQHDGGNLLLCGNEGGAVGIGVTLGANLPAGSLLAVDGKITCEEVLVKMSENWPDYVFSDEYKLKPLHDVKDFIKTNRHLPGIPKAKDIEINGLELGFIQKQMMEKIEELTLYIIKLHEEIEVLKKK
jgi:hypothetical protein